MSLIRRTSAARSDLNVVTAARRAYARGTGPPSPRTGPATVTVVYAAAAVLLSVLAGCRPTPAPATASVPATAVEPAVEPAGCSSAALVEVGAGIRMVASDQRGAALAVGLVLLCGEALAPAVRGALESVRDDAPDPGRIASLPPRVQQIVDLSGHPALTPHFEDAYARLRARGRHRLTSNIRVPHMSGGDEARADDVEITLNRGVLSFNGRALPAEPTLAAHLPIVDDSRRLVVVVDAREPFATLRRALDGGVEAGFRELGLLVAEDGRYRVLPVRLATRADSHDIVVTMDGDGFTFRLPPKPEPRRPLSAADVGVGLIGRAAEPGPDVPLARPGTPLDDGERWDFDALEAAYTRRVEPKGATAVVAFAVEGEIVVRDAVLAAERLRGPKCSMGGSPDCRIGRLLLLAWPTEP